MGGLGLKGLFSLKNLIFLLFFSALSCFFYVFEPVSFNKGEELNNLSGTVIYYFFIIISFLTFISFIYVNIKLVRKDKSLIESKEFVKSINPEEIDEHFNSLREYFSKNFLRIPWKKYEKSIRRIKSGISETGEIKEKLYATIEAENYFDKSILINDPILKLQPYVSHVLVSLGILGTFLGIVIGLNDIDLSNIETTKNSIDFLLSGVQVSFRTSLYGIAYSIILSFYIKYCFGSIENNLYELSEEINLFFPLNTQEDGIKELYFELEKQTSSIQKLASDFAEEVGSKFDKTIKENLAPSLDKFSEMTENLVKISQEASQNAIDSIVNNVGDILTSTANKELASLKDALIEINERNIALIDKFDNILDKTSENILTFESATESVNNNLLDIIETLESDYTKLRLSLQDMSSKLDESINRLSSEVFDALTLINGEYNSIIAKLDTFGEKANEMTSKLDEFNYAQESTRQLWDGYKESFEKINTLIDKGMIDYTNNVKNGLDTIFKDYDSNISKVLGDLRGTIEKFDDSIEELKDVLDEKMPFLEVS
ncbi:MAG: hypothetical protein PWQ59_1933 [Thermoanaerobacterium sp.]|jgi:hypothetical protein|nr:hypothetical protein [Thermoanaerobacterium sp.]MDK2823550.1 hypothetical protein [Clostridia bacterium]